MKGAIDLLAELDTRLPGVLVSLTRNAAGNLVVGLCQRAEPRESREARFWQAEVEPHELGDAPAQLAEKVAEAWRASLGMPAPPVSWPVLVTPRREGERPWLGRRLHDGAIGELVQVAPEGGGLHVWVHPDELSPAPPCKCPEIMAADFSRHFRGCPHRELFPEPLGLVAALGAGEPPAQRAPAPEGCVHPDNERAPLSGDEWLCGVCGAVVSAPDRVTARSFLRALWRELPSVHVGLRLTSAGTLVVVLFGAPPGSKSITVELEEPDHERGVDDLAAEVARRWRAAKGVAS